MRCQDLRPADLPKRRAFCTWILGRTDEELNSILFSDEANFELCGKVKSQNVRRYALLKRKDVQHGGRPDSFLTRHSVSPKVNKE